MSDATIFVAIAFAIVWMKRKQRWKLFFQALEGSVVLGSNPAVNAATPNSATPGTTGAGTPTNNIVNPATGSVVNAPSPTTEVPQ